MARARGKLEVFEDSAQGIENTDLHKMDPYVKITYKAQEQTSRVAFRHGSEPKWKQTLTFTVSGEGVQGLLIKIMDSDSSTQDDLVGEAKISHVRLFSEGSIPPKPYIVVKNREYCWDIKIGLTFINCAEVISIYTQTKQAAAMVKTCRKLPAPTAPRHPALLFAFYASFVFDQQNVRCKGSDVAV